MSFSEIQQDIDSLEIPQQVIDSNTKDQQLITLNKKGISYMAQNRSDLALNAFDETLLIDQDFIEAHFQRAQALTNLNRLDEAIQELNISIDQQFMLSESYYRKGNIYKKENKFQQALHQYDLAIENQFDKNQNGDHIPQFDQIQDIYLSQVNIFMIQQEYVKAKNVINQLLGLNPHNEDAQQLLGQILQNQGQNQEALECYNDILKSNPNHVKTIIAKGKLLKQTHQYNDALMLYDQFLQNNPDNNEIANEKGVILMQSGNYEEALKCFEKVISQPSSVSKSVVINNKGLTLRHMGSNVEAIECYNEVIKQNPSEVSARINLGFVLNEMGKYDEAIIILNQAIVIDPNNSNAYNNKGISYRNKNELQSALDCFEKATQMDEHYILGFANKAQVEQKLGLGLQATISLQMASSLLRDKLGTNSLNDDNLRFIKSRVDKILDLHYQFYDQAEELENVLQREQNATVRQKHVLEEYKQLKKQKDEIDNTEFKKIQDQKQQKDQLVQSEDSQDVKSLMLKLSELSGVILKLQDENVSFHRQMSINLERMDSIDHKQEEMKETIKSAGIYDNNKIREGWEKYRVESPDLYDYIKTFYWTLLNYFDSYRVANTGALQTNESHTENDQQGKAMQITSKILEYGAKLAANLPVVGSVIGAINQAIDAVYSRIKSKKYENRIKAINQIIMLNQDVDAQNADGLSRSIALAALEIAHSKKLNLAAKEVTSPDLVETVDLQKAMLYTMQLVNNIQVFALGEDIQLYSSVGGQEALKDVLLLLIYLSFNHNEILEASKTQKLYQIIADSVTLNKSLPIMKEIVKEAVKEVIIQATTTSQPTKSNQAQPSLRVLENRKSKDTSTDNSSCKLM